MRLRRAVNENRKELKLLLAETDRVVDSVVGENERLQKEVARLKDVIVDNSEIGAFLYRRVRPR